jgi:predicted unusual protein kinase regulating ubiquinone biosynthesis (AarF/ABC1/UbiB family)
MELKDGKPLYRVMGRDNKDQLTDDLLKARKAIHMRGVAHNDMHGGNVLYDDAKKKLNVIDFGLAQISPKAALIEALGGWNARDFQAASMMYRGNGPAVQRYMQNVNAVEAKLKARGLNTDKIPGIRTPMTDIDNYFGNMTDSEAQRLVADIYDGI